MSIVYSAECKASQKVNRSAAMLPILVVLFVVSYCLLTTLVFEQGQTIESQRTLIRAMLQDSTQLAALAQGRQPMSAALGIHRAARAPMEPTQILAIRRYCPAAEGRESDLDTARWLIRDPAAYAALQSEQTALGIAS